MRKRPQPFGHEDETPPRSPRRGVVCMGDEWNQSQAARRAVRSGPLTLPHTWPDTIGRFPVIPNDTPVQGDFLEAPMSFTAGSLGVGTC